MSSGPLFHNTGAYRLCRIPLLSHGFPAPLPFSFVCFLLFVLLSHGFPAPLPFSFVCFLLFPSSVLLTATHDLFLSIYNLAVINQYLRLSRPLPPTALSLLLASFIVAPMPPAALKISPTVMSHLLGCNISCCFLSKSTWTSKRVLCNHGAGSSGKDEPCSGKDEPCSRNSPSIASLFRLTFISLFPIWFGVVII